VVLHILINHYFKLAYHIIKVMKVTIETKPKLEKKPENIFFGDYQK